MTTLTPDFLIIGAMKCGTTSLYNHLSGHPDIRMSRTKELNFFTESENWHKGPAWYASQFEPGNRVRGEASPNYTKHPSLPGVPERIFSTIPNAKLIYIVRDPIDRILSHLFHNYDALSLHGADALVRRDPHYIATSKYWMQIERYLEWFPQERILIVDLDDLSRDPVTTLTNVFRFLGVTLDHAIATRSRRDHVAEPEKISLTSAGRAISALPLGYRLARRWKRLHHTVPKPKFAHDTKQWLIDRLADDAMRFRSFSGNPFTTWSI